MYQCMARHQELAGIVADDHRPGQQAMRLDGTPERTLGGDAQQIGADLQVGDAEPLKMDLPGGLIREGPLRLACQLLGDQPGSGSRTHGGQRGL